MYFKKPKNLTRLMWLEGKNITIPQHFRSILKDSVEHLMI